MKKVITISIIVVVAISTFSFVLKPMQSNETDSQAMVVKTGIDKTGFTESTSW
ncbi:MAG: hypothetical protein R2820_13065 [Cyclobacteriaceae bacterium]|nr:hypothetical protein [Cyclobacteriaceae bacterium]